MYRSPSMYIDFLIKELSKYLKAKGSRQQRAEWKTANLRVKATFAICHALSKREKDFDPMTMLGLATEYHWLYYKLAGIVFPESDQFCNRIIKASFNIDHFDPKPFKQFALMMPNDFQVCGIKPYGVLVTVLDNEFAKCHRDLIIRNIEIYPPNWKIENQLLILTYRNPTVKGHSLQVLTIDAAKIGECLSNPDIFFDSVAKTGDVDYINRKLAHTMIRLVTGLLVYCSALPEAVEPGTPIKRPDSFTIKSHFRSNQNSLIIKDQVQDDSEMKAAHYRSWHFATLRDPKYYQGEHSNEKPGSRIIFRRGSLVNSTAKPVTVIDKI